MKGNCPTDRCKPNDAVVQSNAVVLLTSTRCKSLPKPGFGLTKYKLNKTILILFKFLKIKLRSYLRYKRAITTCTPPVDTTQTNLLWSWRKFMKIVLKAGSMYWRQFYKDFVFYYNEKRNWLKSHSIQT